MNVLQNLIVYPAAHGCPAFEVRFWLKDLAEVRWLDGTIETLSFEWDARSQYWDAFHANFAL